MIRLKPGMQPEEEIDYVISIASMFRADIVAHDYSGAGNLRQTILNSRTSCLGNEVLSGYVHV